MRIKGEPDRDALEKSFGAIVARHEVLRTRFVSVEGNPAQIISVLERGRGALQRETPRLPIIFNYPPRIQPSDSIGHWA